MSSRLKVVDLNPHLSCILCGGYFIDATTITECLHSFCRACIVRYLETSEYCPVCEVQVHKSRPLRSDKILQDIVYKLVPGLFHNEMKRRRELYASQPPEAIRESRDAEDRGECLDSKFIYAPDEIFSLSLEYGKEDAASEEDNVSRRRFLRCPAAVTVSHLKKFVRMKYGIPSSYEIDLRYDKESLADDYTLMDVAYVFLWRRRGPMRFFYKIVEKPPQKSRHIHAEDYSDVEMDARRASADTDVTLTQDTQHKTETEDRNARSTPAPPQSDLDAPPPSTVVDRGPPRAPGTTTPPPAVDDSAKETATNVGSDRSPAAQPSSHSSLPSSLDDDGNKPAIMTVAPLTTITTSSPSVTHCATPCTAASVSTKNTPLPPFKISAHLLAAPKVPPLKLSPPRFSKLEACLREQPSKKSSASRKSKSSKGPSSATGAEGSSSSSSSSSSSNRLELKVAQLKSTAYSVKCVAPLVITVPPDAKMEVVPKDATEKSEDSRKKEVPAPEENEQPSSAPPLPESKDKMDEDEDDLFGGPLVIAEPPDVNKDNDSDSSRPSEDTPSAETSAPQSTTEEQEPPKPPQEDSEDEEIDVEEVDSGRGSDVSSGRPEARSLCGFDLDDLGSPESVSTPKTPETEQQRPHFRTLSFLPKANGVPVRGERLGNGVGDGVLDLSTCGRKRDRDDDEDADEEYRQRHRHHRAKQVANPAVLDKSRQTTTPCVSPRNHVAFKVELPPHGMGLHHHYKGGKNESGRSNFKCRGNTLTVINPDPNGSRPKIVIRNLGPRPVASERFHHHHHHHHHHHGNGSNHQRM